MTQTESVKTEIAELQKDLRGLEVLRIERDHILKHKGQIEDEILSKEAELGRLKRELERVAAAKRDEETRKNAEIESRLVKVAGAEASVRESEEAVRREKAAMSFRESESTKKEAEIASRNSLVTKREEGMTARENRLTEAEKGHSEGVSRHLEAVSVLVSRENDLSGREDRHKEAVKALAGDRAAAEAQWTLIHKSNAELDARRAAHESRESAVIARESAVSAAEKGLSAREDAAGKMEKKNAADAADLSKKGEEAAKTSKDHDLREMELRSKERSLEKRERIVVLKEEEHVRE